MEARAVVPPVVTTRIVARARVQEAFDDRSSARARAGHSGALEPVA